MSVDVSLVVFKVTSVRSSTIIIIIIIIIIILCILLWEMGLSSAVLEALF